MKCAANGFFNDMKPFKGNRVRVVCVLTGHGLKDPDNAIKAAEEPLTVEANENAVLDAIGFSKREPAQV